MKVLHVVESFDGQAIESWLLQMLLAVRAKNRSVEWDFFCTQPGAGRFDHCASEAGAAVFHPSVGLRHKWRFFSAMRGIMKEGRYDILHFHHDLMSAPALVASAGLRCRLRIVHVHNTALSIPTDNPLKIALVREPMRQVCLRAADRIVGVSQDALEAMLAGRRRRPARDQVIHCGIETNRFASRPTERLRGELSLPAEAKVLLFVGRMTTYKNPLFVIEILERLVPHENGFYAVFAGKGPLEEDVRDLARAKGLESNVRVLGWRNDVAEVMQTADVLIWPGIEEPKEGLGLGVVEAQAAGLRIVMSHNVPEEAVVVPELVRTLNLSSGAARWAEEVTLLLQNEAPSRQDALAAIKASSFAIERSARNVLALYSPLNPAAEAAESVQATNGKENDAA